MSSTFGDSFPVTVAANVVTLGVAGTYGAWAMSTAALTAGHSMTLGISHAAPFSNPWSTVTSPIASTRYVEVNVTPWRYVIGNTFRMTWEMTLAGATPGTTWLAIVRYSDAMAGGGGGGTGFAGPTGPTGATGPAGTPGAPGTPGTSGRSGTVYGFGYNYMVIP
ncbi:MAG: hypothetical protein LH624_00040 [Cryobacterium sp.]|nr:hypothetical protein [Cryobacterium sp.]